MLPGLNRGKSPDFNFGQQQGVGTSKLQPNVLRVLFGKDGSGAPGPEGGRDWRRVKEEVAAMVMVFKRIWYM